MCTPPFPATVYPPPTPIERFLPVSLVLRGSEKRTKHRESIAYLKQLRRLKRVEYLNQTSVYDKYCMQLSPCMRVRACLGVIN